MESSKSSQDSQISAENLQFLLLFSNHSAYQLLSFKISKMMTEKFSKHLLFETINNGIKKSQKLFSSNG